MYISIYIYIYTYTYIYYQGGCVFHSDDLRRLTGGSAHSSSSSSSSSPPPQAGALFTPEPRFFTGPARHGRAH